MSWGKVGIGCTNAEDAKLSGRKWFPYNKGGSFRRWYGNNEWLVNWGNDGEDIRECIAADPSKQVGGRINSSEFYFLPAITWSFVSASYFAVRCSDAGFVFDVGGSSLFPPPPLRLSVAAFLSSKLAFTFMKAMNPTMNFQAGNVASLPFDLKRISLVADRIAQNAANAIELSRKDWDSQETSWDFRSSPLVSLAGQGKSLPGSYELYSLEARRAISALRTLETENNGLLIGVYELQGELSPEVPDDQITLYRPDRAEDIRRLLSYAIGCMMGRYSLDKPGLIYAHSGNIGFDSSQYKTFPADDDGIVPLLEADWGIRDDAANRIVEFIGVAWPREHLEENLKFVAESLGPTKNEHSRDTIRRYLATGFYKDHLRWYKRRPIYWLFSSGKQRAFQCLVYLHRYHEGTLARMRTEYVIPLQSKLAARIEQLEGDKNKATSTSHRKKLQKEQDDLKKQQAELIAFDEKLKHAADQKIALDLDDGVKVNYGKFGDLLAEVKAVTGGSEE